jgi:subtilisin family serine protease
MRMSLRALRALLAATALCAASTQASAQFFGAPPVVYHRAPVYGGFPDMFGGLFGGPRRVIVEPYYVRRVRPAVQAYRPRHVPVARVAHAPRIRQASLESATQADVPAGRIVPANAALPADRSVSGELLAVLKPGIDPVEGSRLARRHRLRFMSAETIGLLGATVVRVHVTDQTLAAATSDLRTDERVASVQPNHVFGLADDRARPTAATAPQAIDRLNLGDVRGLATGVDVRVAVIDSGIDAQHPDLATRVEAPIDEIAGAASPRLHGTATAGLIAGRGKTGGLAPDAQILDIKAFVDGALKDDGSAGTTMHVLKALDDAQSHGARLVLLGFSGASDALVSRALASGRDKSMIFIAAAGHGDAASAPAFPAADKNVIAVTASGADDKPLADAARGTFVTVAAPASDLVVPGPGGAYANVAGTSYAAAQVVGLSALLLQLRPDLDSDGLKSILMSTARKPASADGLNAGLGSGVIDARAAIGFAARAPDGLVGDNGGAPLAVGRSVSISPAKDATPP